MSRFLRAIYYSLLILICAPASSQANTQSTDLSDKLLNSERIADRFGNYGIDVVSQNEDHRISNLYSEAGGVRTTRTVAVVDFLPPTHPSISDLHESVLSGQSLGATFKKNGWKVSKINIALESVHINDSTKKVQSWMHLVGNIDLAMHVYLLRLSKDSTDLEDSIDIDYAVIAELHHPEYLDLASLKKIHGEPGRFSNITEILTNSIRSALIDFIQS